MYEEEKRRDSNLKRAADDDDLGLLFQHLIFLFLRLCFVGNEIFNKVHGRLPFLLMLLPFASLSTAVKLAIVEKEKTI